MLAHPVYASLFNLDFDNNFQRVFNVSINFKDIDDIVGLFWDIQSSKTSDHFKFISYVEVKLNDSKAEFIICKSMSHFPFGEDYSQIAVDSLYQLENDCTMQVDL